MAWLARHGRIELSCDQDQWFEKALSGSGITLQSMESDPLIHYPIDSLAKENLGWQPKVNLEDGLKETIAYFRKTLNI